MIKVLMCGNHSSNKGGMTSVINQIREHDWKSEGIELDFIPTYMPGRKAKTIGFFVLEYLRILFFVLLKKPDVFYTHMSVRGSFSRTKALHDLCHKFNIPDIIHLHGSEFKDWYESETDEKRKAIRSLIEECNTFIVLGKQWEAFISGIAPNANIKQIHNCIKIPEETVLWKKPVQFLYMGVFIPRKGVIDLLNAIKLLANRGQIEDCVFNLAGTGEEESKFKEFVNENSLDNHVRFLGWITGDAKKKAIIDSNVFVLPSYNEGLPVSILEAMSYGLPVISTNVGDIGDAVVDNENGYLIEPGDINALADSILKMKNRQEWEHISVASRRKAELEFDITQFYKQLASAWKGVKEYGTEKTKVDRPTSGGEV